MGEQLLGYDIEPTALRTIAQDPTLTSPYDLPPSGASIYFDTGQLLLDARIGDVGITEQLNGVWTFTPIATVRHALPGWTRLEYDTGDDQRNLSRDNLSGNVVRLTVKRGSGEAKFVYSLLASNIDPYELSNKWLRPHALQIARRYEVCPWDILLVAGTGISIHTHACQTADAKPHYIFIQLTEDGFPASVWTSDVPTPSSESHGAEFSDHLEAPDVGLTVWLSRHHLYMQLEPGDFTKEDQEYFKSKTRERSQRHFYYQPDTYDHFSDCWQWFQSD